MKKTKLMHSRLDSKKITINASYLWLQTCGCMLLLLSYSSVSTFMFNASEIHQREHSTHKELLVSSPSINLYGHGMELPTAGLMKNCSINTKQQSNRSITTTKIATATHQLPMKIATIDFILSLL